MAWFKRWRRWSARLMRVGTMVSALTIAPGLAWSQEGIPADKMPPRHFTKNTSFHLPVQMSPGARAETREIQLYVKQGANDWVRVETAPATATHFTPKVSREGEYWFTLVTVSKAGKSSPSDPGKAPPGLRVVVDTTAPMIDVQPHASPEGDFCIRCNVLDPNFDSATLTAVSKTDRGDRPLEQVPGMSGTFKVPSVDLAFPIRVTAADLAKNVASKDINIRDMVAATMKSGENISTASHKIATPPLKSGTPPGLIEIAPPPALPGSAPSLPPTVGGSPVVPPLPPTAVSPPGLPPTTATPTTATPIAPPPMTLPPRAPLTSAPAPIPKGLTEVSGPVIPGGTDVPPGATRPKSAPIMDGKAGAPRQIVNTPQVSIDYRIDHVGPSGVGKVDVYLTNDNAQTWKRVKEDMDRRSPVEVELPGEGLFGIKLVITNGNGFGGAPPVRGEQPTCWVEVDTTSPHVALQPIDPVTQNGQLEVRWNAGDANIAAEPVSLYFRTRADGPWTPIARGLRNDGMYRWAFPRDMGGQFWLKAEVVDQAGNVARSETPTPVTLDMTEPRASVLGISSITIRPTAPVGN